MPKTIYLAGPMRGYELWNFPAFDANQKYLEIRGWSVISPAAMDREHGFDETVETTFSQEQWETAMRRDYEAIMRSDAIALLPGWHNSEGAKLEREMAIRLGVEIYHIDCFEDFFEKETIIGLCGFARSGKDTLAQQLVANFGFERRAFADPMRDILYKLNPLVITDTGSFEEGMLYPIRLAKLIDQYGWEKAKESNEVRSLLQRLGTEAGRDILGDHVWMKQILEKPHGPRLVISDVRFPNEAEAIKRRGGVIVRIQREGYGPVNAHESEVAYSEQDILLENYGSPIELLENLLTELKKYEQNKS